MNKLQLVARLRVIGVFDDQVHPNVKHFWTDVRKPESREQTPLAHHPFFAMYGDQVSREGYKAVKDANQSVQQRMNDIIEVEQEYKHTLEQLAIQIVSEIWDCPKDLFEAHLEAPTGEFVQEEIDQALEEQEEEGEEGGEQQPPIQSSRPNAEISPEDRKHINKRLTMNMMTHGAAVHHMQTAHHLAQEAIKDIDPELLTLYSDLSKFSHKMYWAMFNDLTAMEGMQAGQEEITWENKGCTGPNCERKPKIIAYGMVFPILVQELSKGVMELLTMHQFTGMSSDVQEKVVKNADGFKHEQWLIQTGPEMWRKFIKLVPRDRKLADIVAAFSTMAPDQVEEIMEAVIDNPEKAQELLNSLET